MLFFLLWTDRTGKRTASSALTVDEARKEAHTLLAKAEKKGETAAEAFDREYKDDDLKKYGTFDFECGAAGTLTVSRAR